MRVRSNALQRQLQLLTPTTAATSTVKDLYFLIVTPRSTYQLVIDSLQLTSRKMNLPLRNLFAVMCWKKYSRRICLSHYLVDRAHMNICSCTLNEIRDRWGDHNNVACVLVLSSLEILNKQRKPNDGILVVEYIWCPGCIHDQCEKR